MKLLLDTHTLLWAAEEPERLGTEARPLIEDPKNSRSVSAATIWELAIKIGLGKLQLSKPFLEWVEQALGDLKANVLPISPQHAAIYSGLPFHHRDPFDRLLVAQSQYEEAIIVSVNALLDPYGIRRIW